MNGNYSGESIAKKVARVRLYRRVRAALLNRGRDPTRASVFFLAGPECAELGAIRHVLGADERRCVAVDIDEQCCASARARSGDLTVFNADLTKDFPAAAMKPYDFVHLDLCGHVTHDRASVMTILSSWTVVGGVMAVTFLRGRESPKALAGKLIRDFGGPELERLRRLRCPREAQYWKQKTMRLLSPDAERACAYLLEMNAGLAFRWALQHEGDLNDCIVPPVGGDAAQIKIGDNFYAIARCINKLGSRFVPLAVYAYWSSTPMGVVAAQLLDERSELNKSNMALRYADSPDAFCVIGKDPMAELLAEADRLSQSLSRDQVAEVLNVSPGTLTAWRAHRTMGTYGEQERAHV